MIRAYIAVISLAASLADRREGGQGLAEYALAAGLVAILGLAALTLLGQSMEAFYRALMLAVNG